MLSREEYEQIIRGFLVELNHLCLEASDSKLRVLPGFSAEIDDYLADLRDPESDAAQVLYTVFAYLDEYIGADWPRVIAAGYDAYVLTQRQKGSEPDPESPQ